MHSRLIFGLNAILGTSIIYSALRNVDFVLETSVFVFHF